MSPATGLATATVFETAVQPLEIRHLFGQFTDNLPLRAQGLGVESMTSRAQLGLSDMLRLCRLKNAGLRVPMNRIGAIVNGRRSITADTAMRLARYFGTSAQYWLNLQTAYDLGVAGNKIGSRVESEVLPRNVA